MESFRNEFAAYVTVDSHLTKAKCIYHLKYMATEATEYFKEQFRSPSAVALPDPYAIRKFIQREQHWEPVLSQAFLINNKILEYCQQQYPSAQTLFPVTQPYGPARAPIAPAVAPEGAPLVGAVVS